MSNDQINFHVLLQLAFFTVPLGAFVSAVFSHRPG